MPIRSDTALAQPVVALFVGARLAPERIHFNQFKWWRLLCERLILNSLYSYAMVTCQHVASMNRISTASMHHANLENEWNHFHALRVVCVSKSEVLRSQHTLTPVVCHTRTLLKMTKSVHYLEFVSGLLGKHAHLRLKCLVLSVQIEHHLKWWWRDGRYTSRRTPAQDTEHICRMKNGNRK